ncbi:hypothetical protein C8Q72DRAFT_750251, partial [Fomitopsis betulina]
KGKPAPRLASGTQLVKFELSMIKYHAFGDYPDSIHTYGIMDVTSSQAGELEHRCLKKFYPCTNFTIQVGKLQRCMRILSKIRKKFNHAHQ